MTSAASDSGWLLLVTSLSGRRATQRMRLWRTLKACGAAVLRDGVYLLPARDDLRAAFAALAREIEGSGGQAHLLTLTGVDALQAGRFRALFDRSAGYARLLEGLRALNRTLTPRRRKTGAQALRRLRREYEALRATDHFPGPAAAQVTELLAETEARLAGAVAGEPRPQAGTIRRLDARHYRGRVWATRARPWVDRLASAWLIRRRIDPRARFLWLDRPADCPERALGFDFDGASFTHVGARVTFETLLASFGLDDDAALLRLGALVHHLDVGGVPVAEAAGVAAILRGMRERISDDDALLAEALRLFDHLYDGYQRDAKEECR